MAGLLRRSPPLVFVACIALAATGLRAQISGDPPPAAAVRQDVLTAAAPKPPPRALTASLFAGFIATQALDVHSTLRSIDAGNRETNASVRWATSSPSAFIGLKAATTTATCLLVDRVRRAHPKAAVFLLAGLDTAYTAIVAHNYTAARHR